MLGLLYIAVSDGWALVNWVTVCLGNVTLLCVKTNALEGIGNPPPLSPYRGNHQPTDASHNTYRLFSDRVVTILVGPHETKWCLHENLLSGASEFFKSAFNSGFKESLEGKITMPEDDPHAFELFVRWLYTRALMPEAVKPPAATAATTTASALLGRHFPGGAAAACIQDYLHLYVLASKLLIEDLENACVDMAHAYYGVGMRRPDIKDGTNDYPSPHLLIGVRL